MNELMDGGREERTGDEIGWSPEKFKKGERRRRRARINSKQFHPLLDLATSVRPSGARRARGHLHLALARAVLCDDGDDDVIISEDARVRP